jgi:hypothetical protein
MNDIEQLAGKLYEAYRSSVGGQDHGGQTLPTWQAFRADPAKRLQSNAWVNVAVMAIALLK